MRQEQENKVVHFNSCLFRNGLPIQLEPSKNSPSTSRITPGTWASSVRQIAPASAIADNLQMFRVCACSCQRYIQYAHDAASASYHSRILIYCFTAISNCPSKRIVALQRIEKKLGTAPKK